MKEDIFFGDIVVVEDTLLGVVVKVWIGRQKKSTYEVYVRSFNCIKNYTRDEIERYAVRHKELNEEEIGYQFNGINKI